MNVLEEVKSTVNKKKIQYEMQYAIEYLKSSLSVSNYVGCGLGCLYCSVQEFSEDKAKKIMEPEEAVEALCNSPLLFKAKTPITLNNRTDPMAPIIKQDTFEMMRILEERGYYNTKIIISKMELSEADLEFLEGLKSKVIYIVSYGGFDSSIEKVSNDIRIKTLQVLKKRKKVISLHYWRPIIKNINDSEECIETVLSNVKDACDGSIISGLRLNTNIYKKLSNIGAELSEWDGDTKHKYIAQSSIDKIIEIRNRNVPGYQIFRHTSCAISCYSNMGDYNFHYLNRNHCFDDCMNKNKCKIGEKPDEFKIKSVINKLEIGQNWRVDNEQKLLYIDDIISEEDRSSLMHVLQYPVKAKGIKKSFSEEVFNN